IDPSLLVGGREAGGKSIPAERCLARIEKHDIVRHQAEQADNIASVDGIDPGRVHLADCSFIRSHLQPLPPSMRMVVKPHQAFFLAARTVHAAGLLATSCRVPALFSPAFFSRRRRAAPSLLGGAKPLVGWRVGRSGRQARTTVYPCGTSHGPKHLVPYTPRASGTPQARAHPSNERCLHRFTRRHNGGSFRPPSFPAAATAASLVPFPCPSWR